MGGSAVHHHLPQFPVGSLVEVRTDEEGFKGVFYVATVVPSSARQRGRKSLGKIHIEYHNLLASENAADRLKESVDVSYIRPAPPPNEDFESFGLNDTVDAFHRDGWWTGKILKVLEGGRRFVVTFWDPPDELEFGLSELRVHWDWCNGTWFRPEKQGIARLMFDVGRKVEVSFDVEGFQDAWFPATICEVLTNGTYLVGYHSSNISNEDQFLKATVDSFHVRPYPPFLKDKSYVLFEKVDCFFNFGWWNGVIIKVLEDCRYVIFFKQKNKDKEFHQSDLRPHMDWKECIWSISSSQLCEDFPLRSSEDENLLPHASENAGDNTVAVLPIKTLKEQNISEVCKQVTSDRSTEELLCSSGNDITVFTSQPSTMDQSSENLFLWELRNPQNLCGKDYSISRISEKCRTPTLQHESSGPDCGVRSLGINFAGMEQDAVGNAAENALNNHAEKETKLAVIIGLPCSEIDSSGLGKSRGERGGYRSSSKKILRPGSDQIQNSNVSAIAYTKISEQTKTGDFRQKRKRRRPHKELMDNLHVLVTGNAKTGSVASSYIGRKDGDSHGGTDVVMTDNSLAFNEPNDELTDGSDLKNSNKNTERTLAEVYEQAMKESARLPKSRSKRGGRQGVEDEQLPTRIKRMQIPTSKDSGKTLESISLTKTLEKTIDEVPHNELDEPLSKCIEGMKTPTIKDSDSIDQSPGKTIELNCLTEGLENVLYEVPSDEFDEPLSKWIKSMKTPATIKDSRLLPVSRVEECVGKNDNAVFIDGSEKQNKSGVLPCAFDDICTTVPNELEDLPFVKNVVLWKAINSMGILQRMPQRPHFRPLVHLKESSREGLAVGYMVTFSRVVEKASSLQINDPGSITEEILETLQDLERYGFDVKVVEDCVGQMLELKHKQEDLKEEAKGIDSQISHHSLEKQKMDEEMSNIRRQILMLQEKISVVASAQENEESEIVSLQSKRQKLEEDTKVMELEFQNLAASL